MTVLLDALGEWRDLGTVTPIYGEWRTFPTAATLGYSTFRATFIGEWYLRWHWTIIRESYSNSVKGTVVRRLYPDSNQLVVFIPVSEEFLYLNPQRYLEIKKVHKYINTSGGHFTDKIFTVKLEEFSPYQELLDEAQKQTLKENTIQQVAELVVSLLPPSNS